ncbi:hypothetical protein CFAM422_007144 [Trichoderma lentiforme]|uniref:Uncharacterized protein n=1 Tax=Trichoderma lentiforme TaxID=1567552 RepID=A0A9P4XDU0_9HYPO|nr:hypothetical protein CFAM422_007144 [Trichoderma lentiforme]
MQLRRLNKDGAVPLCRWWRKDWGKRGEEEGERRGGGRREEEETRRKDAEDDAQHARLFRRI